MAGKAALCAAKLTVAAVFSAGIADVTPPYAAAQSYHQGITPGAGVRVDWDVLDSLGQDRAVAQTIAPDRAAPPAAYGAIPNHLDYIYTARQSQLLTDRQRPGAQAMTPGTLETAPSSQFFGLPSASPSAAPAQNPAPQDRIVLTPPDAVAKPASLAAADTQPRVLSQTVPGLRPPAPVPAPADIAAQQAPIPLAPLAAPPEVPAVGAATGANTPVAPPVPVASPAPPPVPAPRTSTPQTSTPSQVAALEVGEDALTLPFDQGSFGLSPQVQDALRRVAGRLQSENGLKAEIQAFASGSQANSSKARRLSLSRALAVRTYLIDQGIRSTRIDVRALGNNVPSGPADRVDVKVSER